MFKALGLLLTGVAVIAVTTHKSDAEVQAQIEAYEVQRELVVMDCVRDYKAVYKNKHYMNVVDVCDMVADGERVL